MFLACPLEMPYSRYTCFHWTSQLDLLDNQVLLLDQMAQFLLTLHRSLLLDLLLPWLRYHRLRLSLPWLPWLPWLPLILYLLHR